jgi:hypothetical protein
MTLNTTYGQKGTNFGNAVVIDTATKFSVSGLTVQGAQKGIYIATSSNGVISDTVITDCNHRAIDIVGNSSNITVSSCVIEQNNAGILVGGTDNTIIGCFLDDNGDLGGGEDNGISVSGENADNNLIIGCQFDNAGRQDNCVRFVTANADDNVVQNCDFRGGYQTGGAIAFAASDGDNVVQNCIDATETVTADGTASLIDSTYISGASTGVDLTLGDGPWVGFLKTFTMTNASNASTVVVTDHETSSPETLNFNAIDEYLLLIWTGTEWATVSATATP